MTKIHLEVVVASTSEQKLEPTRLVFRRRPFGRKYEVTVTGVKAGSEINEQPLDDDPKNSTRRGAENRLANAQRLRPDADIWLSMENGIRNVSDSKGKVRHQDYGVVLAEDRFGHRGEAMSDEVEFPDWAYLESKRRGFDTTTVGSVFASETNKTDPDILEGRRDPVDGTDPHSYLTRGKKPRKKLLGKTIKKVVKQLPL